MSYTPPLDRPPNSTFALIITTALTAGIIGYFIGTGSSLGLFSSASSPLKKTSRRKPKTSWPNSYDVNVHVDSSDEELTKQQGSKRSESDESDDESEDSLEDGEGMLKEEFEGHEGEEVKMVLCVRTDLGMGKGKIAAQASHATLAVYKHMTASAPSSPILKRWERGGQAKVALKVESEDEMLTLQAQALSLGLAARVIQDAGRTQIVSGTRTVLGILGPKGVVDQVTGHLKLL